MVVKESRVLIDGGCVDWIRVDAPPPRHLVAIRVLCKVLHTRQPILDLARGSHVHSSVDEDTAVNAREDTKVRVTPEGVAQPLKFTSSPVDGHYERVARCAVRVQQFLRGTAQDAVEAVDEAHDLVVRKRGHRLQHEFVLLQMVAIRFSPTQYVQIVTKPFRTPLQKWKHVLRVCSDSKYLHTMGAFRSTNLLIGAWYALSFSSSQLQQLCQTRHSIPSVYAGAIGCRPCRRP